MAKRNGIERIPFSHNLKAAVSFSARPCFDAITRLGRGESFNHTRNLPTLTKSLYQALLLVSF
jgi:hypothetical protein